MGWAQENAPAEPPVAKVNGQPIGRADFDKALLTRYGARALYDMITEAVVEQAAQQKGVKVEEEEITKRIQELIAVRESERILTGRGFQEWMQASFMSYPYLHDVTRIQLLKEKLVEPTVQVTDKDVEEYWIKYQNQPPITMPEQRRVSHISFGFNDYDTAVTVLEAVRKQPEKFAELARKYSTDWTSKNRGGDIGYIARGRNPDPLQKAVFEPIKPGLLPDLVKTAMGFHIVRIDDIKPAETKKFDDVKDDIRERIRLERVQRAVQQWTADALKSAKWEVLLKLGEAEEPLPPPPAPAAAPAPAP